MDTRSPRYGNNRKPASRRSDDATDNVDGISSSGTVRVAAGPAVNQHRSQKSDHPGEGRNAQEHPQISGQGKAGVCGQ